MAWRRIDNYLRLSCAIACLIVGSEAVASEYHGQVTFSDLPVPGATVTATNSNKKFVAITDQQGHYSFPDLPPGTWTMEVEMQCFSTIKQDVVVAPNAPPGKWELHLLLLERIKAETKPVLSAVAVPPRKAKSESKSAGDNPEPQLEASLEELSPRAADGLLIRGSVNNGAVSPFAQLAAFGNNRNRGSGLYTGGIGVILDNSGLDARPFSLTGQSAPKAAYNRVTGVLTLGGPLRIPHLVEHGPVFFVGYQWTRRRDDSTEAGLVPDSSERSGDFSRQLGVHGQPIQIFDPTTGLGFPGNVIPQNRISPQAKALLKFYPLPNVARSPQYNYQVPIVSNVHQDALQSRFDKTLNAKNQLYGNFAFLSKRSDSPNLFAFLDRTDLLGINTGINWSHRFSPRLVLNLGYRFSRLVNRAIPYWENRENASATAGITGNNQDPMNWGPPTLTFAGGLAGLSDAESSLDRHQTSAWSSAMLWNRVHHNFTFGGDFRRQQFNYLSQQDPRGTFTFTGAATQGSGTGIGSDFADFLLGIPDTSSIAFGNPDKYFRESVYDAYITDDWRVTPQLSVNVGVRWEYGAPIRELYNRLVNLDIVSNFTAVAPVLGSNPIGSLTGQRYPSSLLRPDKSGFEPRVGVAWRPFSGSSLVVRAGYGTYYDSSVYQTIALKMAQQAPLSNSLNIANSSACPLTLAHGFNRCRLITADSFAVNPNFRVGYAENWQLSVERDLPGSLHVMGTYLGIKGTRGVQEFLPNTFPIGAVNPCPTCPRGFAYLTSSGNSSRQAAQLQLRRRLHNGLAAKVQYTFSKSIDDDSAVGGQGASLAQQNPPPNPFAPSPTIVGGIVQNSSPSALTIAQNWLDLRAERGLSSFDQRHLLTIECQYTTGMGLGGKTLLSGWKGVLLKEWNFVSQFTVGSGLPQTPVYLAPVPGTGITGTIRPDYTGAPIYSAPSGLFLNPAAYRAPRPGEWGNAGRDSIIGPAQFTLNASLGRIFRLDNRLNLEVRLDSTNLFNHGSFTGWNTTINSTQFGLPIAAHPMRSIESTMRLRF